MIKIMLIKTKDQRMRKIFKGPYTKTYSCRECKE